MVKKFRYALYIKFVKRKCEL